MAGEDLAFVSRSLLEPAPPPSQLVGPYAWTRQNLFPSPLNSIATVVAVIFIFWVVWSSLDWLIFDATFEGQSREACLGSANGDAPGACWAFVKAKFGQFIYGRYPIGERWRVNIVFFLFAALLVPMAIPKVPRKRENAVLLLLVFPIVALILLTGGRFYYGEGLGLPEFMRYLQNVPRLQPFFADHPGALAALESARTFLQADIVLAVEFFRVSRGFVVDYILVTLVVMLIAAFWTSASGGSVRAAVGKVGIAMGAIALILCVLAVNFGLQPVETSLWGGLLVTLVVAVTGIVASLPLGVLLALGRRSKLPMIKWASVAFVELWRGVPLITVLFMASVMLPFFLPPGVNFDKLMRALIGVALFSAAYMAEVVRGGLQAVPRGQYEAASAVGLGYSQSMRLIVLPQALKIVIPGIVNSFISLFKDTSLVLIIGIFDLLGIVQQNFTDPNWASPVTPATGFVFAAVVYWIFCFSMSRYSQFMERRLNTGHKR